MFSSKTLISFRLTKDVDILDDMGWVNYQQSSISIYAFGTHFYPKRLALHSKVFTFSSINLIIFLYFNEPIQNWTNHLPRKAVFKFVMCSNVTKKQHIFRINAEWNVYIKLKFESETHFVSYYSMYFSVYGQHIQKDMITWFFSTVKELFVPDVLSRCLTFVSFLSSWGVSLSHTAGSLTPGDTFCDVNTCTWLTDKKHQSLHHSIRC